MPRTKEIPYISPEQVFKDVVEQLQKQRIYQSNMLFRCFPTKGLTALRREGNDRVHTYTESEIRYGKTRYEECKQLGIFPDDIDWETFNIMDEYNLKPEDFIFASTELEVRDWLDNGGMGDNALMRLSKNLDPTSISMWDSSKFLELPWHGYEFIDKTRKGKKSALVKVFKIRDMKRSERQIA